MGLFNNLRRYIVRKLIRLGDVDNCTKFYYNENDNVYIRSTGPGCYSKPTLVGWRDAWMHSTNLKEIPFDDWIYGVLENVCDLYFDKLDSLTPNDFKNLSDMKKDRDGEKLMISKQSFCDIMETLDKYWGKLHSLEEVLNVVFEDNMLTKIFDNVINALEEDLEPDLGDDEEPILCRWLLDLDAGRDVRAKEIIEGHPLTTAAELYDYLVWKRDGNSD